MPFPGSSSPGAEAPWAAPHGPPPFPLMGCPSALQPCVSQCRELSLFLSLISETESSCMIFLQPAWPGSGMPGPGGIHLEPLEQEKCSATSRSNGGGHSTSHRLPSDTSCPDGGEEAEERKGVEKRNWDQRRAMESNFRGVWGAWNSGPILSLLFCWLPGGLCEFWAFMNHSFSSWNTSQLPPALPMAHFLRCTPLYAC